MKKRAKGAHKLLTYGMCSIANDITQYAKEMVDVNLCFSSINCFSASSRSSLCCHLNKCIYLLKWHLYQQNNCKDWHIKICLYGKYYLGEKFTSSSASAAASISPSLNTLRCCNTCIERPIQFNKHKSIRSTQKHHAMPC